MHGFRKCQHAVLTSRLLTRHALHSLVLLAEVIRYIFLTRFPYPTSPVQRCPPEQQWRAARLCRSNHRLLARTCIRHASKASHRALPHDVSWLSSAKQQITDSQGAMIAGFARSMQNIYM